MVYVVQDDGSKNFSPALKFGDIATIMTNDYPKFNTESGMVMIQKLRKGLDDFNAKTDHLLLTGDPVLIGLAMYFALQKSCTIRCLKWDKQTSQYIPITIKL